MPSERPSRREWTGPKMGEGYSTVDIGPYVFLSPPAGAGRAVLPANVRLCARMAIPPRPFFRRRPLPRAETCAAVGEKRQHFPEKHAALFPKTCSTFCPARQATPSRPVSRRGKKCGEIGHRLWRIWLQDARFFPLHLVIFLPLPYICLGLAPPADGGNGRIPGKKRVEKRLLLPVFLRKIL